MRMDVARHEFTPLTPAQTRARRRRAIVTALVLGATVALVFALTIFTLGPAVLNRPL